VSASISSGLAIHATTPGATTTPGRTGTNLNDLTGVGYTILPAAAYSSAEISASDQTDEWSPSEVRMLPPVEELVR
jgi:hypothetical protein